MPSQDNRSYSVPALRQHEAVGGVPLRVWRGALTGWGKNSASLSSSLSRVVGREELFGLWVGTPGNQPPTWGRGKRVGAVRESLSLGIAQGPAACGAPAPPSSLQVGLQAGLPGRAASSFQQAQSPG